MTNIYTSLPPGPEIREILDNLCASLPPDEFKAFMLMIGENLPPKNHKIILGFIAPDAVAGLLDRTILKEWGGVGRNVTRASLNAALPRRAAKTLVNRWLRDADAPELKRVVIAGLAEVGDWRL